MTTLDMIQERLKALPADKQQEILDFIEFLSERHRMRPRTRSVRGLCADLGVDLSAEAIDDARREMWARFPREDLE